MNFFSIMSTSKIPSNGLYKLPGSCLYVHILSDGEQRIILKSSSKTVISEASVPLFVEEYRKIKRDRVTPWHKLYNPFVESNVDQILQDKNWAWSDIHSSNNENNEETPQLVKNRKYLVYPIPPGYRSKIDDIIDAMRKRHKERGISDEESATLIDNYLFENNIIFYKKGIKQLYEYPLLCAHHTMTGDIRHCVGIEINEKIKLFKVKKDKICIVFDKLNKLDPSLSGQNQRVKDLIKAVKVNSSVSLSFTGDPSKKYESLLAEYHLLFFHTDLELQNYHNDVFFCMNKAVNLVLSYHMRCFIKLMNIYHIDTTHIVFDVLYDKVHEFGCHLQYNARRLFNGKLHKKQ
eukprot:310745_1